MDKRFLIALVLTAIVVIATPWLFGTQSSPRGNKATDTTVARDSSKQSAPDLRPSTAGQVVETPPSTVPATPSTDTLRSVIAATAPETTTVALPLANYRFSNIGATPLAVELKSYKALDGSKR